jgi:hypothetical protein
VKAVLGAEVSHQRFSGRRRRDPHILIEGGERFVEARQVRFVVRGALEGALAHAAQDQARIAVGLLPQLRIEVLEQRARRTMPAEKEVTRELGESGQAPRKDGGDFEERISHR